MCLVYAYMQVCLSVSRLTAGERPDESISLKRVLSVVSEDLRNDGAKARLIDAVDLKSEKALPKLVGFHKRTNPQDISWAVYLNKRVLLDDAFHLTKSLSMALLHMEIVRKALRLL